MKYKLGAKVLVHGFTDFYISHNFLSVDRILEFYNQLEGSQIAHLDGLDHVKTFDLGKIGTSL